MIILHPRALVRLEFLIETKNRNRVAAMLPPGLERAFSGAVELAGRGALGQLASSAATIAESRITESQQVDVVPIQMEIRRTPYSEADSFDIEIDLNRFPLDPRIVREVRVEAHLDVADSALKGLEPDAGTIVINGYADRILSNAVEGRLILEGRDLTSLLIDRPYSGEPLDLTRPAEELIRGILDSHQSSRSLRIDMRYSGSTILANLRADANGQQLSGETRDSCWDVISRLAAEMGAVAWVESDTIVIAERQRTSDISKVPSMIWGRNLTSLTIERGTAGRATPPVVVASWDPTSRRSISAMWPELESTGGEANPSLVNTPNAKIFTLANVSNAEALRRAARAIWTRMAEADVALRLETRDVTSVDGSRLMLLRSGDSLSVYMNESERVNLYGLPVSARSRYLEKSGYSPSVAQAIAGGYEELAPLYQVREMVLNWSARDGLGVRIECANLITVG